MNCSMLVAEITASHENFSQEEHHDTSGIIHGSALRRYATVCPVWRTMVAGVASKAPWVAVARRRNSSRLGGLMRRSVPSAKIRSGGGEFALLEDFFGIARFEHQCRRVLAARQRPDLAAVDPAPASVIGTSMARSGPVIRQTRLLTGSGSAFSASTVTAPSGALYTRRAS